jgi:predicted nucleic acid-binding protein
VSPGHRREFLLDSGAISALANDPKVLRAYADLLRTTYSGSLRIPITVMTECRTGDPRYDTRLNRLLSQLDDGGQLYIPVTLDLSNRAGVLRYEAMKATHKDISPTDAQIVAIAEELGHKTAVTILTGDLKDMKLLVGLTHSSNIAVQLIG